MIQCLVVGTKLLVLEGYKKTEKYVLWLQEFVEEVFHQNDLSGKLKCNTLLELVKLGAKIKTRLAFNIVSVPNNNTKLMFTSVPIKLKIDKRTHFKWGNYLYSEEYQYDILKA